MNLKSYFSTAILLIILGVCSAAFYYFRSPFTLRTLTCSMDGEVCPDYILAEINEYKGKSFFFTDLNVLRQQVLEHAPSVSKMEFHKTFPDTVSFTLTTSKALYVFVDASSTAWTIDVSGFTTKNEPSESYEKVSVVSPFQFYLGETDQLPLEMHQGIQETFTFLKDPTLEKSRFELVNEQEGQLILENGEKALFSLSQSTQDLNKLKYFLSHSDQSMFKAPIEEIDLRFGQVIVRTATPAAEIQPSTSPNPKR